ncbi:MAG: hypothetical protein Q4B92_08355, partial [Ruminococcus sp.]|nr:hypothetical protein [Ruminococcus sp.]
TTAEPTEAPTTTAAPTTVESTEAPATLEATVETTLPKPDVPKTGDSITFVYMSVLVLLAAVACVYVKKRTA